MSDPSPLFLLEMSSVIVQNVSDSGSDYVASKISTNAQNPLACCNFVIIISEEVLADPEAANPDRLYLCRPTLVYPS
ncbi:hypothetical protein Tco_0446012 [Tanacetum coccineum]